ncbi:hypothetical protein OIY81_3209 [Cryptosporidium canis]|uniref:C2H2-type domain-containing protein n=1 Tax=Cryptosporidium canis TaxID=195482 RepID=A0ABQ8PAU9_9CRYT|nr:hypothetical protein OIY81_3209 [Cryptosporidium canis]KAJ1614864.1 hypothetical protein OJ252_469 [Cryptosporidium canis]
MELGEDVCGYSACRLCEFDIILLRRGDLRAHLEEVHALELGKGPEDAEAKVSECTDSQVLRRCYNEQVLSQLRSDLCEERQREFYEESGKDLSIFEATETLKVAILLFLAEFKRKIVALNFPKVKVQNLENEQLNQFLLANQGAFYFYSLVDLAKVDDITVQMLLARSWDWSEEDQDLRREISNIRDGILPDDKHPSHSQATQCILTGKMLLLTMHESVKHLLLLCYLTKKVIKRQD